MGLQAALRVGHGDVPVASSNAALTEGKAGKQQDKH